MRALRLGAAIVATAAGLCTGMACADAPPPRNYPYPPGYTPMYQPTLTYDWTGIYFGGHIGAANFKTEWIYDEIPGPLGLPEAIDQSQTVFAGGGQIGLQKQWSSFVLGAEVAYTWADSGTSGVSANFLDRTLSTNTTNLLLATGKLGFANDNMLAYFKAGYATGTVEFRSTVTSTGVLAGSSSDRQHGWTAGAGLEYALLDHVILGAEYNYIMFNVGGRNQAATVAAPLGTEITDASVDIQTVTARLSFKFGGARPELVPSK